MRSHVVSLPVVLSAVFCLAPPQDNMRVFAERRDLKKSPREVDLRVALFDDDNALIIYDAEPPPPLPRGDSGGSTSAQQPYAKAYIAYWMNYQSGELSIFGRRLHDPLDVGHALRNLRRDLGSDPSGLLELDPELARALSLAETEPDDATLWHSASDGILDELLHPSDGDDSNGDAVDASGIGSVADTGDGVSPDSDASSCPPETMGGGFRRFIPGAPKRSMSRDDIQRAVLHIVGCGGACDRCVFAGVPIAGQPPCGTKCCDFPNVACLVLETCCDYTCCNPLQNTYCYHDPDPLHSRCCPNGYSGCGTQYCCPPSEVCCNEQCGAPGCCELPNGGGCVQTHNGCCLSLYEGVFGGPGSICCANGHCCPVAMPVCCPDGHCCPEGHTCCGTGCVDPATQKCCPPDGGGAATVAGDALPEVCSIDNECCINVCCADGYECCDGTECCDPLLCKACVDYGSLSGGTITVDPPVVCVGDTITFTVSDVVDSGGTKRAPCLSTQAILGVTPTYTWELTKPDGTGLSGAGDTASTTADIFGMYSCIFTAFANRLCPPPPPHYAVGPKTGTATELKSETLATVPSDRARTTIGVCEQVTIATNPAINATWSIIGGGSLSPTSGTNTMFSAADASGNATITATFTSGAHCEIQYTVIVPTDVSMSVIAGSTMHTNGTASAGFQAAVTKNPQSVSFGRVQTQEQVVTAVTTGSFNVIAGLQHPQGSWVGAPLDTVTSGTLSPPFAAGTFLWAIPWHYRCVGSTGTGTQFTVVDHIANVTDTGEMTVSKGGASITCQPSDPTTP